MPFTGLLLQAAFLDAIYANIPATRLLPNEIGSRQTLHSAKDSKLAGGGLLTALSLSMLTLSMLRLRGGGRVRRKAQVVHFLSAAAMG